MRLLTPISAILLAFGCAALDREASAAPPQRLPHSSADEVTAVLQAQQEAWNKGDLEAFMNGYMRSNKTVFVSRDEITRGWTTVYDRYRRKYSDRARMGRLLFSDLEISQLASDVAIAVGRWQLKRASDKPHGYFTLILRKTPDGWRIIHDHTS